MDRYHDMEDKGELELYVFAKFIFGLLYTLSLFDILSWKIEIYLFSYFDGFYNEEEGYRNLAFYGCGF